VACVELDPAVAAAARDYFGFALGPRCSLRIGDALDAVREIAQGTVGGEGAKGPRPDILMVDVDAGGGTHDLSFPPAAFVTEEAIRWMAASLRPGGLLVLNLACRQEATRERVLGQLRKNFGCVSLMEVGEDVENIVVLAQWPGATMDEIKKAATDGTSARTGAMGLYTEVPLTAPRRRRLTVRASKLATGGLGSVDVGAWLAKIELDPELITTARELEAQEEASVEEAAAGALAARLAALGVGGDGDGKAGDGAGGKQEGGKKQKKNKRK